MYIDDMQAGRELDVMVAEKVMGWHGFERIPSGDIYGCRKNDPGMPNTQVPFYSTDIAVAWDVVKKAYREGVKFDLSVMYPAGWRAWFGWGLGAKSIAETAPLAICRAVLKAMKAMEAK